MVTNEIRYRQKYLILSRPPNYEIICKIILCVLGPYSTTILKKTCKFECNTTSAWFSQSEVVFHSNASKYRKISGTRLRMLSRMVGVFGPWASAKHAWKYAVHCQRTPPCYQSCHGRRGWGCSRNYKSNILNYLIAI